MGYAGEKLLMFINWIFIFLGAILTEDVKQSVMFFLGAMAALITAAHKIQEMHYKAKDRKKEKQKKEENEPS